MLKDPKRIFEGNALLRRLVRSGVLDQEHAHAAGTSAAGAHGGDKVARPDGVGDPLRTCQRVARERAKKAAGALFGLFLDSMVTWLEDRDGLTDEERIRWWGRIVRENRAAGREAFRLD